MEALQASRRAGESHSEPSRIRNLVLAAILAAAPQISCSGDIEESTVPDIQEGTNIEQVKKGKGEAKLSFDGYDWYFQGTYPESFELEVYASTEPVLPKPTHTAEDLVYEDVVAVDDDGKFELRNYSGSDETVWVTIKAFQENGEEIIISPTPGPEGMYGIPYAVNSDKLP